MNTEILGVVLQIVLMVVLAYPLGKYIAKVYKGQKTWSDFMKPIERLIFKVCGINPAEEMNWKQFLKALLILNAFWFVWGMVLLVTQHWLPLNPDGNGPQTPDQAFNTCISFMVNCNLQHYSGESGLTYFTQLFVIMLFQFITAATGMAAMAGIMKSISVKTTKTIGNFWNFLVLSSTRILLPLSLIVGFILIIEGTPMGFDGKMEVTTLEGQEQLVSQGPAAAIVPIKQLGTNGGGFFNANSSHPFENPTPWSNFLEMFLILVIPTGLLFTFGEMCKDKKQGYAVLASMLLLFVLMLGVCYASEKYGNPIVAAQGISGDTAMEGKEVRFGIGSSSLFATVTTAASCGAVNSMHDSYTGTGGLVPMLQMMLGEVVLGGVGAGFYGMMLYVFITVFIVGLMVGRTPEYLGKKIEAKEVVLTIAGLLIPAATILTMSAVSCLTEAGQAGISNPGPHGLSEILYGFASGVGNNGSAFAGLGANSLWYNVLIGLAMLIGRFAVIVPVLAIAGNMATKKIAPANAGTFNTGSSLFAVLLAGVVLIVGALTFLPALALGPIVDQLFMLQGKVF